MLRNRYLNRTGPNHHIIDTRKQNKNRFLYENILKSWPESLYTTYTPNVGHHISVYLRNYTYATPTHYITPRHSSSYIINSSNILIVTFTQVTQDKSLYLEFKTHNNTDKNSTSHKLSKEQNKSVENTLAVTAS